MQPAPPKFDKSNHHYIPQFWIRYFADAKGTVWKRQDGKIKSTSSADIMAEDWLYTEFDQKWRPSDLVEDNLSKIESKAALLFEALHAARSVPDDAQWAELCCWIALTACRHPITMRRGHRRGKELAYAIADASSFRTEDSFFSRIQASYGVGLPRGLHAALETKGDEALLAEAEEIEGLSPQDPRLPMIDAILAMGEVARRIDAMDLLLVDAPPDKSFVLGDAPVALSGLSAGFATPLSPSLALGAWPNDGSGTYIRNRREADPVVVDLINRDQAERSAVIVVGPDRAVLQAL